MKHVCKKEEFFQVLDRKKIRYKTVEKRVFTLNNKQYKTSELHFSTLDEMVSLVEHLMSEQGRDYYLFVYDVFYNSSRYVLDFSIQREDRRE